MLFVSDHRTATHPDDLMADIAQTSLSRKLLVATVIHIAVIALTSMHYINLCISQGTFSPEPPSMAADNSAPPPELSGDTPQPHNDKPTPLPVAAPPVIPDPIREVNDISKERPTPTGISFDDVDELE